jgi:hypothetical protein
VTPLSHRDRALLRAVSAGRCEISGNRRGALVVDGNKLIFCGHHARQHGPRLREIGIACPNQIVSLLL